MEGELKYVKISGFSTVYLLAAGVTMVPAYTSFETLMNKMNKEAPEGVNNGFQSARYGSWAWIDSETALITNAQRGIRIALAFAFIVIFLTTQSLSIAVVATVIITSVILCALAIIQYFGWQFGIAESVSSIVLIGLSVDYVVHIAAFYSYSTAKITYKGKFNVIIAKIEDSLSNMIIPIIGAASTTLIAAFPLYFCKIVPFFKFGVLITGIVLLSMSFALLLFPVICLMCFSQKIGVGNLGLRSESNFEANNENSNYFGKISWAI